MNAFLTTLIWLAALSAALITLYWTVIYPIIVRSCLLRIRKIQDEVRLAVFDKSVSEESRAYHEFEWFLNIANKVSRSPATFALSRRPAQDHEIAEIRQRIEHIEKGGEPLIMNAFTRLTATVFMMDLAVRPAATFCVIFLAFTALFSQMAKKLLDRSEMESFVFANHASVPT